MLLSLRPDSIGSDILSDPSPLDIFRPPSRFYRSPPRFGGESTHFLCMEFWLSMMSMQVWRECWWGNRGCICNCRALYRNCLECIQNTKGHQPCLVGGTLGTNKECSKPQKAIKLYMALHIFQNWFLCVWIGSFKWKWYSLVFKILANRRFVDFYFYFSWIRHLKFGILMLDELQIY